MEQQISLLANPSNGCYVEWQCPNCHHLHQTEKVNKIGALACHFEGCHKKWRIGVGFTTSDNYPQCHFMGDTKGLIVNSMEQWESPQPVGRLYGTLQFQCPSCHVSQKASIPYKTGAIPCSSCNTEWFVQLLLWRPVRGVKAIIPFDWSVPAAK